ncbi:hypothetical protein MTBPR1_60075 [Candidatus Terasakiella magnetica]|uniref:CULT domain-containing protein n=1 Tax=Candidatus Terasakiella magnetica TaxID=1867952 RepID=A0A1C3RJU8_9PROT|nr:cereblon family protein [Candidatus Terasakiella magnetica]SCA57562.1 hypothetical protein MTBPR1_60075 [Candidatus Terasakiella magnetica]
MPLDAQKDLSDKDELLLGKEKLFCASCGHWVTTNELKVSIKEAHDHTVFNPAGIVFNIGCFRDAPGCWATGTPSSDFSWFSGYHWRMALCEGCGKHMGWLFTGGEPFPAFYGLILKYLSETSNNDTKS